MTRLRLVKVGGSLLDLPDLAGRLAAFIESHRPARHVFIAGGGSFADAVRAADETHTLGDEASHWLCVDCMKITAGILHHLLTGSRLVFDLREIAEAAGAQMQTIVLDVERFLKTQEATTPGSVLPRDWTVSSDSIAARVAHALNADELVLLKSRAVSPSLTPMDLARAGIVDATFPLFAKHVPAVRYVNLRSPSWVPHTLSLGGRGGS